MIYDSRIEEWLDKCPEHDNEILHSDDNGIVVVDNIYRLMKEEGLSRIQAAKLGIGEVALPIIVSTATTIAAFIPLGTWPGIIGEFMKFLPITLMIVLGSSLFVALVINPVLIALMARMKPKGVKTLAAIILIIGLLMTVSGVPEAGNILMFIGLFIFINPKIISPVTNRFQVSFLPKLENSYKKFLSFALFRKRPISFFFGVIGLFVLSIF